MKEENPFKTEYFKSLTPFKKFVFRLKVAFFELMAMR